jgi:hypothetical protein
MRGNATGAAAKGEPKATVGSEPQPPLAAPCFLALTPFPLSLALPPLPPSYAQALSLSVVFLSSDALLHRCFCCYIHIICGVKLAGPLQSRSEIGRSFAEVSSPESPITIWKKRKSGRRIAESDNDEEKADDADSDPMPGSPAPCPPCPFTMPVLIPLH